MQSQQFSYALNDFWRTYFPSYKITVPYLDILHMKTFLHMNISQE